MRYSLLKIHDRRSKTKFNIYTFFTNTNHSFAVSWLPKLDWGIYIVELAFRLPVDRSVCPANVATVPRLSSRLHHFEICGRQDDSWEQARVVVMTTWRQLWLRIGIDVLIQDGAMLEKVIVNSIYLVLIVFYLFCPRTFWKPVNQNFQEFAAYH